jgi:hypothetical protein
MPTFAEAIVVEWVTLIPLAVPARPRPLRCAAAGSDAALHQSGSRRHRHGRAADEYLRDPITLGVGLVGVLLTLPLMDAPFTMALGRMLQNSRSRSSPHKADKTGARASTSLAPKNCRTYSG